MRAARKALRGAAERHGEGVPRWRRRSYLSVSVKTEKHTLALSVTNFRHKAAVEGALLVITRLSGVKSFHYIKLSCSLRGDDSVFPCASAFFASTLSPAVAKTMSDRAVLSAARSPPLLLLLLWQESLLK
ncbi:unnamed protein product [Pleuronectes platessa]|uniref:Uncharacterized protein n=1 Tax=Pleuronectes platessa TaxID=8262 RepID=A0A9N7TP15_PLEPL|nr:unnamed protein product [Pleuronectes platessa]